MIDKMCKDCNRLCATPTRTCKHYHDCTMVMCEAGKIGIDTAPIYWSSDEVKKVKECVKK